METYATGETPQGTMNSLLTLKILHSFLKNGPFPASFFFIFIFSIQ